MPFFSLGSVMAFPDERSLFRPVEGLPVGAFAEGRPSCVGGPAGAGAVFTAIWREFRFVFRNIIIIYSTRRFSSM